MSSSHTESSRRSRELEERNRELEERARDLAARLEDASRERILALEELVAARERASAAERALYAAQRDVLVVRGQLIDLEQTLGLRLLRRWWAFSGTIFPVNSRTGRAYARVKRLISGGLRAVARMLVRIQQAASGDGPGIVADPAHPTSEQLRRAIEDRYRRWIERTEPSTSDLERQRAHVFALAPRISVVMPVAAIDAWILREAIDSVLGQTYANLELCVAAGGVSTEIRELLDEAARRDDRLRVRHLEQNGGISANTNAALECASGEFVAFMDHDDTLAPFAIHAIVAALNEAPDSDVLYSDEDKIDAQGRRHEPFLKPAWSPELLQSFMYVGHLSVYRREILSRLGGLRSEFDGSQDYDLLLRATEITDRIRHVPGVLYHWRMIPTSAAAGAKPEARRTNVLALEESLRRRGIPARVEALSSANRPRFELARRPLVSIVIPSDHWGVLSDGLDALTKTTSYDPYEVLVVTNPDVARRVEERSFGDRVRCVPYAGPFNFSAKCNHGARAASGEFLVFLNDDVRPLSPDWIEVMLGYAQQPDIGGVSPKLLYEDGRVQYAGMHTGVRDLVGTTCHRWNRDETCYRNFLLSARNVSVLSGACFMVSAKTFADVGGFDEQNTPVDNSDLTLSFALRRLGRRLVYVPFAELVHLGNATMRRDFSNRQWDASHLHVLAHYGPELSEDPSFPSGMRELLQPEPPFQVLCAARDLPPSPRGVVLLMIHDLSLSGAPMVNLWLTLGLRERGYSVFTVAAENGPLRAAYEEAGLPLVLDARAFSEPEGLRPLFAVFDTVISHTVLAWRAVRAVKAAGRPVLWMIHEAREGRDLLMGDDPASSAVLSAADRVIVPSEASRRIFLDLAPSARIVAIHCGLPDVSPSERMAPRPFERQSDSFHVVTVGSIERRKNQILLVEAVRLLPPELRARVVVHFVGRVLDERYARDLQVAIGGDPNFRFVGYSPRPVALSYVLHADVAACTSREETGPLVVLEALALGTPVLTTRVGVGAEILRDRATAVVVEPGDPQAYARGLADLMTDATLRARLRERGRAFFDETLRLDRYVDRVVGEIVALTGSVQSTGEPFAESIVPRAPQSAHESDHVIVSLRVHRGQLSLPLGTEELLDPLRSRSFPRHEVADRFDKAGRPRTFLDDLLREGVLTASKIAVRHWQNGGMNLFIRQDPILGVADQVIADEVAETYFPGRLDLSRCRTILDVGGHIGGFSVLCKTANQAAKVVRVEPDPDNFALSTINLEGFDGVVGYNTACAHGTDGLYLAKNRENSGLYIVGPQQQMDVILEVAPSSWSVLPLVKRPVTLEQVMMENRFDTLDLLKIDCEGCEREIFRRTPVDVFDRIRVLIGEWHGSAEEFLDAASGVIGPCFDLIEMTSVDPGRGLFLAINRSRQAEIERHGLITSAAEPGTRPI